MRSFNLIAYYYFSVNNQSIHTTSDFGSNYVYFRYLFRLDLFLASCLTSGVKLCTIQLRRQQNIIWFKFNYFTSIISILFWICFCDVVRFKLSFLPHLQISPICTCLQINKHNIENLFDSSHWMTEHFQDIYHVNFSWAFLLSNVIYFNNRL